MTERQTDGQTDGRAIAYSALSIYVICCQALKTVVSAEFDFGKKNKNQFLGFTYSPTSVKVWDFNKTSSDRVPVLCK